MRSFLALMLTLAIFPSWSQEGNSFLQPSYSYNEAVYGNDNRVYVEESQNPLAFSLSRATAALIPKNALKKEFNDLLYSINKKTLSKSLRVCADEPHANDSIASICSGFLVGPDLLVTAGHCIKDENDCANASWVFDYRHDLVVGGKSNYFSSDNIYSCKQIVSRKYRGNGNLDKVDFSLIRLTRKVHDRLPLRYRISGKIEDDAKLMMIGYPSGLPAMITDEATVRNNRPLGYFTTNLDAFAGNSGSPVLNANSGIVEGILVRGEKDYVWDTKAGCNRLLKCGQDNCRGEDVTRITEITELIERGDLAGSFL